MIPFTVFEIASRNTYISVTNGEVPIKHFATVSRAYERAQRLIADTVLLNEFILLFDPDLNLARRIENRTRKEAALNTWAREDTNISFAEIQGVYNNIDAGFDPSYLALLQEYYVSLLVQSHESHKATRERADSISSRSLRSQKIEYEIAGADKVDYYGYEPRGFST